MKKMRRILAILLSAVLLCTLAFGVSADEATQPSGNTEAPAEVQPEVSPTETADAQADTDKADSTAGESVPPENTETAAPDPSVDAQMQNPETGNDIGTGNPESENGDTSDDEEAGQPGVSEGETSDDAQAQQPEDNEGDASDDEEAGQPGDGEAPEDELPAPDDGEAGAPDDEADAEAPTDDAIAADVAEPAAEVQPIERTPAPTITVSGNNGSKYCPPVKITVNAPSTIATLNCGNESGGSGQTTYSFTLTEQKTYTLTVTDNAGNSVTETIIVRHGPLRPGSTMRQEPTCTTAGKEYDPGYCSDCGESMGNIREHTLEALGHDFKEEVYEGECVGAGPVTVKTCTRCGLVEGDASVAGSHTFEDRTTAATCKDPGMTYRECTQCGYKQNVQQTDPPTGKHTLSEWTEKTPATCLTQGVMRCECTVCHQEFEKYIGAANGHDWEETGRTGSTCDQPGTRTLKCKNCQETMTEEIDQLGHDFSVEVVLQAATCTNGGTIQMKCSRCGTLGGKTKHTSKLGHDESGAWQSNVDGHYKLCKRCNIQINKEAHTASDDDHNCTTALTCSVCGYVMEKGQSEHNLTTTTTADNHTVSCRRSNCNYQQTAQAHTFTEADPSDCTSSQRCTVCGYTKQTNSQHNPDTNAWQTDGQFHWRKCLNAGCQAQLSKEYHKPLPDDGNCTTAVTCSVCGKESKPAQAAHVFGKPTHSQNEVKCQNAGCNQTQRVEHNMTEKSRTTKQKLSCTQDEIIEVLMECSCGHTETREERTPARQHNMGAWETQTAGSCQTGEIQVRRCQYEDCTYTETQGLQAAGHKFGTPTVTQATCEADGLSTRTCEVCGFKEDTEIPALGHDYKVVSTTEATCEDRAIEHKQCTRCQNEIDETSSKPAPGHDFRNYVSNNDATCTKNGTETAKCTRCDAQDTRDVPNSATGHQYESDGDCTTADICLLCKQPGSSASAHAPGGEWQVDAATGEHYKQCANEGCTQRVLTGEHIAEVDDDDCTTPLKCSVCAAVLTPGTDAHTYGAWSSRDATSHTRSCLNPGCNAVEEAPHSEGEVRTEGEEASCTTPGKVTHRYYCADCETIYKEETIESEALDHDFTDWEVMESPDCNNEGASRRECRRCGLVEEKDVDPMGHDWNSFFTVDVEPTCERDGSRSIHCSKPNCSATMDSQVIPALGHDFQRSRVVSPASCLNAAVEEVVCADCGASTVRESTLEADRPLGHDFSNYIYDNNGTCTRPGTETATCPRCGTLSTRPAEDIVIEHQFISDLDCTTPDVCAICGITGEVQTGHNLSGAWESDEHEHYKICANAGCSQRILAEPHVPEADDQDCTTGVKCAVCDKVLSEGLAAHSLGSWVHTDDTHTRYCLNDACTYSESGPHDEVKVDEQIIKAPNCTETGHSIVITYCSVCEAIVSQEDRYPEATGHSFGPETSLSSPDCDDAGSTQRVCGVCGYTETTTINPSGHDWAEAYTTDKAPTCTEDGSESIHCKREGCTATKDTRTLHALGHDFGLDEVIREATCVEPAVVQARCKRCDATATASTGEPLGHEFVDYVSDNDASCTVDGNETAVCTRCDATDTRTAKGSALGHIADPETAPRVVPPTCTEAGLTFATCERCGEEFLQSTQSATGHTPVREADLAPNCTQAGYKGGTSCSVCGVVLSARETIPALGHTAVKEADLAASCTRGGYTGATSCSVCGAILNARQDTPALGHSYGAWTASGTGSHSSKCARCGNERTQPCSYSEMHIGGAKVDVCKVCGHVVDSANGQTTTADTFRIVEGATYEAVDPGAMPAGELIVRELDMPFGYDIEVLEAFTVACELDGDELALNGRVRVTMPLVCDEPFRLYRVDEVINPETGEQVDQLVELEYIFENGLISFETDVNGLFLIVPESAVAA